MIVSKKLMRFLLRNVRSAINNIRRNDELKTRVAEFGFDDAGLDRGMEIHARAKALYRKQTSVYGDQYIKSARVRDMVKDLKNFYMRYAKLIRRRLKRDETLMTILGLNGKWDKTLTGLIDRTTVFFTKITEKREIFDKVSNLGISEEKMGEGLTKIDNLNDEEEIQESLKSEAQDTTESRNKVFQELYDYHSELRQGVMNGTEDRPQLREAAGIKAYSDGYLRQRRKKKQEEEEPGTETPTDDGNTQIDDNPEPPVEEPVTTELQQQVSDGTTDTGTGGPF